MLKIFKQNHFFVEFEFLRNFASPHHNVNGFRGNVQIKSMRSLFWPFSFVFGETNTADNYHLVLTHSVALKILITSMHDTSNAQPLNMNFLRRNLHIKFRDRTLMCYSFFFCLDSLFVLQFAPTLFAELCRPFMRTRFHFDGSKSKYRVYSVVLDGERDESARPTFSIPTMTVNERQRG